MNNRMVLALIMLGFPLNFSLYAGRGKRPSSKRKAKNGATKKAKGLEKANPLLELLPLGKAERLQEIQKLTGAGTDVINTADEQGLTLLHHLCIQGDVVGVYALLELGAILPIVLMKVLLPCAMRHRLGTKHCVNCFMRRVSLI